MHGNVLLGTTTNVDYIYSPKHVSDIEYIDKNGVKLNPIGNTIYKEKEEIDKADLRVLFKD
jgi:hypothetical protein